LQDISDVISKVFKFYQNKTRTTLQTLFFGNSKKVGKKVWYVMKILETRKTKSKLFDSYKPVFVYSENKFL